MLLLTALVVVTASPTATEDQIVLIGAGFGRTGTASTKIALEQLGLGPTHHMKEVKSPSINTPGYDFSNTLIRISQSYVRRFGAYRTCVLRVWCAS